MWKEIVMRFFLGLAILALIAVLLRAQPMTFSSGSTGADGALTFTANAGLVYFNPANFAPRTNNVYNFTTVTIPSGTTVRLSGYFISGPVYWLAQGNVTINGTLDLSGGAGHSNGSTTYRVPSEPGAGGYSGGLGRTVGAVTGQVATAGNGPGGGAAAGFNTANPDFGAGGSFTGNNYLEPLVGGSGGGGGCSSADTGCGGGGAGGGAILIASSTQITLSGGTNTLISVQGGSNGGTSGGGGSGGAIRLISNTVTVTTATYALACAGGTGQSNNTFNTNGTAGLFRIEAFNSQALVANGGVSSTCTGLYSVPYNLALPAGGASSVSVTNINGTPINANPFTFPDTTITTASPVPITISGSFIPPGTSGKLYIFSETTPDQAIPFTLTGSLASTTATVNVTYPPGGSRGFAKVTW
jgi:hypothetical protein